MEMETPIQVSIPLPRSVDTRIYIHLTVKSKAIMLFVTTASTEELGTSTPLGSFVYALPNPYNTATPLCTSLCTVEPTLEFAQRLARLVAKRSGLPTYVSNSISLANAGLGGTVEEELEVYSRVVEAVLTQLNQERQPALAAAAVSNGVCSNP